MFYSKKMTVSVFFHFRRMIFLLKNKCGKEPMSLNFPHFKNEF